MFRFSRLIILFGFFMWADIATAQPDTEFPAGFITVLKLHNGMVTDFTSSSDLFVGGVRLSPQVTVIPYTVRAGLSAGAFFSGNRIDGQLGPTVSVKLKTFNASFGGANIGSIGNVHLLLEHLWGTNCQKLLGGGVIMDAGNLLTVGLTSHRDYHFKTWWFQTEVGIRISKKKRNPVI